MKTFKFTTTIRVNQIAIWVENQAGDKWNVWDSQRKL